MCCFSLTTASRSSSFDTVDRLLTGQKFFVTDLSRPAFFSEGVTMANFIDRGNRPVEKEAFARCAMMTESST